MNLHTHGSPLPDFAGTTCGPSQCAGVKGLKVLKTTQSGYEGFLHDKYTLLKDTKERIVATSITSTWRCFPWLLLLLMLLVHLSILAMPYYMYFTHSFPWHVARNPAGC